MVYPTVKRLGLAPSNIWSSEKTFSAPRGLQVLESFIACCSSDIIKFINLVSWSVCIGSGSFLLSSDNSCLYFVHVMPICIFSFVNLLLYLIPRGCHLLFVPVILIFGHVEEIMFLFYFCLALNDIPPLRDPFLLS